MKNILTALTLVGVLAGGTAVFAISGPSISGPLMVFPSGVKEYTVEKKGKIQCADGKIALGQKEFACLMQGAIDGPLLSLVSSDLKSICNVSVDKGKIRGQGCRVNDTNNQVYVE